MANAIEKIGQAVDASYTESAQMVTSLEGEFAEPIQEHSQFAHTVKQVLRFRHLKHAQMEMIEGSLENKKDNLENLQQMESEARRLEEAISRERTIGSNAVDVDELNESETSTVNGSNNYSYPASDKDLRRANKPWGSPIKMINAVGHSLQNIIDVDPEATRRNQIGKTKDAMDLVGDELLEIPWAANPVGTSCKKRWRLLARIWQVHQPSCKANWIGSRRKRLRICATC